MKRSDLKDLGIEDKATIDGIMSLYGEGIESAKAELETFKAQISERDKSITELTEQIKTFDGKDGTLKELQEKVATYEKEKSDREAAEIQAKTDLELKTRFDAIKGENKFNHELVEKGRFEDFKKALTDEQFKGKGDSDIFGSIVKPEDLINPQQATIVMPGGGGTIPKDLAQAKTFDEYKAIRKAQN